MADLKPCPFCGRTPTVEDCGTNRWFVRCKCGIAQDKLYAQKCDAVRAWNRRKSSRNEIELVRCKECVLNRVCRFGQYLGLDGFCSHGERRDG